jgi:hypothetical protein
MDRSSHIAIPEGVELVYRKLGNTHVFSSKGIKGLLHIGSVDRETAFNNVVPSLNAHVAEAYGCEAVYSIDLSYNDFCKHVDSSENVFGNFIHVTLANDCVVSH